MTEADILQEQINYYRARANEYDEWWNRTGRFDHGETLNQQWFDEAQTVQEALEQLGNVDSILELACGTGIWTQALVKQAKHVLALDASPEVIAINKAKVNSDKVTYQQVDLFTWQPEAQYDLVFFSFWLSHVPPEKLTSFLKTVYQAVKVGGKVFMLDSRHTPTSTAINHTLPKENTTTRVKRTLNDNREYTIVKVFYQPDQLQADFQDVGFTTQIMTTPHYFIYGQATKDA